MRYEIWDLHNKGMDSKEIAEKLMIDENIVTRYKDIVTLEVKIETTKDELALKKYIFLGLRAYPITRLKSIRSVVDLINNIDYYFNTEHIEELVNIYLNYECRRILSISKIKTENGELLEDLNMIHKEKENCNKNLKIFTQIKEEITKTKYVKYIQEAILDIVGVYKFEPAIKVHLKKDVKEKMVEKKLIVKYEGIYKILNLPKTIVELGNYIESNCSIEEIVEEDKIVSHIVTSVISIAYDESLNKELRDYANLEKEIVYKLAVLNRKKEKIESRHKVWTSNCKKVQFNTMKLMSEKGYIVAPHLPIGGHMVFLACYHINTKETVSIIVEKSEEADVLGYYFDRVYKADLKSNKLIEINKKESVVRYREITIKNIIKNNNQIVYQKFMS